jgi:hypothetical protein
MWGLIQAPTTNFKEELTMMTRKEMIEMIMGWGFPYIITSAFVELHIRYGYATPYAGRPESKELDEDMVALGHVPIEHVSFKAKHPNFGHCTFTLQKYTRNRDRRKPYYCMFVFNENGEIWDERGPFAEREVVSDMDHLMDRFMKSEDTITTLTSNPVSEFKYITTSPA